MIQNPYDYEEERFHVPILRLKCPFHWPVYTMRQIASINIFVPCHYGTHRLIWPIWQSKWWKSSFFKRNIYKDAPSPSPWPTYGWLSMRLNILYTHICMRMRSYEISYESGHERENLMITSNVFCYQSYTNKADYFQILQGQIYVPWPHPHIFVLLDNAPCLATI